MKVPTSALVLAAGEGTRMRPLTAQRPKPLLEVAGSPLLGWTLRTLAAAGLQRVVVLVGYRHLEVQRELRPLVPEGMELEFQVQTQRLGTGHAVLQARERLLEPFFCLNGDVLLEAATLRALAAAVPEGHQGLVLKELERTAGYGLVEFEADLVKRILEKPPGAGRGHINAGCYLLDPGLFDRLEALEPSPRGEYELTTALEQVAREERLHCSLMEGPWLDVGRPWDLLTANELLLPRLEPEVLGEVEPGAVLKGWVRVEEGALVKAGSYLEGPVLVGPGAVVGPNAYLRAHTTLGRGVRVGAASEVKNSLVGADTRLPHHNYVGDSVLGRGCNLGSGTKVANLRLDHRAITTLVKGERVATGRRKLGVIMGDGVQTGINACLNVGTVLGEGSFVGPGALASGYLAPGSRVF